MASRAADKESEPAAGPALGEVDALVDLSGSEAIPRSRVEKLFREHNDALLRFLRGKLDSDADAREVAQEAYVRLLRLDQLDHHSFLAAYLFKIASNVATDVLRSRSCRSRLDRALPTTPFVTEPTQETGLAARQQLEIVQNALREVPPRCREAFLLRRRDGWATARIADHLNVSERMVRLYLERALEHTQNALARSSERRDGQ